MHIQSVTSEKLKIILQTVTDSKTISDDSKKINLLNGMRGPKGPFFYMPSFMKALTKKESDRDLNSGNESAYKERGEANALLYCSRVIKNMWNCVKKERGEK